MIAFGVALGEAALWQAVHSRVESPILSDSDVIGRKTVNSLVPSSLSLHPVVRVCQAGLIQEQPTGSGKFPEAQLPIVLCRGTLLCGG